MKEEQEANGGAPSPSQVKILDSKYISSISVLASQTEFQLAFGAMSPVIDTENNQFTQAPHIDWIGSIAMNPALAKNLSQMLADALNNYEKAFGDITPLKNMG